MLEENGHLSIQTDQEEISKDLMIVKSCITYMRHKGFILNDLLASGQTTMAIEEFAEHLDSMILHLSRVGEESE